MKCKDVKIYTNRNITKSLTQNIKQYSSFMEKKKRAKHNTNMQILEIKKELNSKCNIENRNLLIVNLQKVFFNSVSLR